MKINYIFKIMNQFTLCIEHISNALKIIYTTDVIEYYDKYRLKGCIPTYC